jgi:ABC-type metal ion transport system substrate-binding protein
VFPNIQLPTINTNYATQAGSIPGKHRSFVKIQRSRTINPIAVDANDKDTLWVGPW